MTTTAILLTIYIASVVSLLLFMVIQKVRGKSTMKVKENLGMTIAALILAPISWILGIIVVATDKTKVSEPKPVPKKLRTALKKDRVLYDGKIMSIAEVNRLTRKKYKLEDIYGKKYVAALTEDEISEFDDDDSELWIMDKVRKDGDFDIVHKFAKARMSGKLDNVKDLFAEDACIVTYEREVFHGADEILSFWKNRYESSITRNVKFNYRIDMCMFYNGPALYERPERYASMIVTFKIKDGKIEQMLLAPEYLSTEYQYYGGFREAPYTLDYFKPFLGEPLESRKFRVPCPNCGRLSEDLEWYTFNTKGSDSYHCYGGTVSICQHCKRTVEIFPIEQFENDSIDKSNYEDNEQKDKQAEIKLPNISYFSFVFSTPLVGTKYLNSLDDSEPLDGETTDPFDNHNFVKNSWSLLDFARIKGKMQLATINNQEDGKPFKVCVFTSPEGKRTIVTFSSDLGELTSAEIVSRKLELQVDEISDGLFVLEKASSIKKKDNSKLCTEKKIVSEFNSNMISKIYGKNRPLFDEICYCYKKAYDDGIIEAGNNLAILYINYADREEEGMQLLKECAEKGCANAASNYFITLWGNLQDYTAAIEFALSCKTPAVSLYWNIAALYLRGEEIKGNPLTVDVEKAKHYLRIMSDQIIPVDEDETKVIEKARKLLSALDNLDPLRECAKQYIESTLPQCIQNAENGRRVDSVINRELPHIRIPSHTSLWLRLADDHNGHGDISEFILRYGQDQEGPEIAREKDIISHIKVDKSELGAWEVYLFSKARHFLPTFWHGAYNRLTLVFNREDMKQIPSQKGRSLDVMLRGENLKPKVYFEGDTAYVECCYWTEWGGLFREKCKIEFKGNEVTCFENICRENIYMYDCGIMF